MDRLSTAGKEESGRNKRMAGDDHFFLDELLHVSVPLIANGVLSQPAPGGEFTN